MGKIGLRSQHYAGGAWQRKILIMCDHVHEVASRSTCSMSSMESTAGPSDSDAAGSSSNSSSNSSARVAFILDRLRKILMSLLWKNCFGSEEHESCSSSETNPNEVQTVSS